MTQVEKLSLNICQGLLIDPTQSEFSISKVIGAYNTKAKRYWLKEGVHTNYLLPEFFNDYEMMGSAGHFEVTYWDFDVNGMLQV